MSAELSGGPFLAVDALRADYLDVDWTATPLGPLESWSEELRRCLRLVLDNRFPASLFWGPELIMVYNRAFVGLIADKHPQALGAPASEVFDEAWEQIGPLFAGVRAGRGAVHLEDALVPLDRHGYLEECYFTFAYSPIHDGDEIVGVIDIATETTEKVVVARRLSLLGSLAESLADVVDTADFTVRLGDRLRAEPRDVIDLEVALPGVPSRGRLPAPSEAAEIRIEEVDGNCLAWIPLRAGTSTFDGTLTLLLNPALPAEMDHLPFLALLGEVVSRALERLAMREIEQQAVLGERRLSEALQRSLLSRPAAPDRVAVAARYQPAADRARVGGDWYDAFELPEGDLAVVIGDVAGHDSGAAAAMAQVRNLLRGIALSGREEGPAGVLSTLDAILPGLGVEHLVTAVLGRLTPAGGAGGHRLAWSNAGHLPPVLRRADGTVEVLRAQSTLLLGLEPDMARHDEEVVLGPGDLLVLYTDGLVERRDWGIDQGIDWLAEALVGSDEAPEALCDRLMRTMPPTPEDDVALLVVQSEVVTPPSGSSRLRSGPAAAGR